MMYHHVPRAVRAGYDRTSSTSSGTIGTLLVKQIVLFIYRRLPNPPPAPPRALFFVP